MEKEFTDPDEVVALPSAPLRVEPAPVKPVPVYELTRTPSFKHKVEPEYPRAAREKGVEGVVMLEILIDEQGRVRKVRVLSAPDNAFAQAAVAAIRQSSFHPGLMGERPVAVKIQVPFRFVLDA
ncbi:MAG: energy transducer TonB [Myxococcales bacterium]|nr:MAG: energy transducer TonB [Myxococcales bacterium]